MHFRTSLYCIDVAAFNLGSLWLVGMNLGFLLGVNDHWLIIHFLYLQCSHLLSTSEYSRKLAALENTAFPEHSVFSSPPLFSGFLTCFLYFHQEILKYLLTNLPVCAAAFID